MADLPSANVFVDDEAGSFGGGTGFLVVLAAVALNADIKPRVFASTKGILGTHGYSDGAAYCALHFEEAGTPVLFVGLPIVTAGAIGRQNATGVTGTSVISAAAGPNGVLAETDVRATVKTGGTIGTNGIVIGLSLDGGRTSVDVRLGTASSYTIPYVGIVLNFGAGTLVAGDVYTFTTTAPLWDAAGIAAARTALGAQLKSARSFLVVGDLPDTTAANAVVTAVNAYETSNDRFVYARAQVRDRLPLASMSRVVVRMTGAPTVTFAEVGATGDTLTRSAGSFISDGFVAGMSIDVSGSVSNNFTKARITAVSATVLTLDTQDLVAEGPASNITIVGSHGLTFAEVGATGDTITRSGGSFIDDGFRAGDTVTVAGTASNNVTGALTAVTATVLTFNTTDLATEFLGTKDVTITKGETQAVYVALMDSGFASIDDQRRIDLGLGRARKTCPITGSFFRRPIQWAASIREYGSTSDLHIPTWRKSDGPLSGWSLEDADGNVVEFDERTDGGALAARFTCARTYANGPRGTFIALSLTRAPEASLLSRTHNLAVANLACSVVQAETENAIGQVLVLNKDGTGTGTSLALIEGRVNSQLQIALLQDKGFGPRASSAVWRANRGDILNVVGAELVGTLDLRLNGTLETITTRVRILTAG